MSMDWNDPAARARFAERVGPAAYNAAFRLHIGMITVAIVNGYRIIPVHTRFGKLYHVDGANMAFATRKEAEDYATTLQPKETT